MQNHITDFKSDLTRIAVVYPNLSRSTSYKEVNAYLKKIEGRKQDDAKIISEISGFAKKIVSKNRVFFDANEENEMLKTINKFLYNSQNYNFENF